MVDATFPAKRPRVPASVARKPMLKVPAAYRFGSFFDIKDIETASMITVAAKTQTPPTVYLRTDKLPLTASMIVQPADPRRSAPSNMLRSLM
eukprot:scaffold1997_cov318-Pavlova_lutheri.AAC.15